MEREFSKKTGAYLSDVGSGRDFPEGDILEIDLERGVIKDLTNFLNIGYG